MTCNTTGGLHAGKTQLTLRQESRPVGKREDSTSGKRGARREHICNRIEAHESDFALKKKKRMGLHDKKS